MATTVPKTVVPLPATIIGAQRDESGNLILDEAGNPIIQNREDQILDAIYALGRKVDIMGETIQQQVEALTTELTAANTAEQTALASIQTILSGMQPGSTLTQADLDALKAAVAGAQTNATMAQTIATSTATATEAPPAP